VETILQTGLSNALVASALALVVVLVGYFYRKPALIHGLWLLVLLKLATPPLVPIPIHWPAEPAIEPAVAPAPGTTAMDATVPGTLVVEMPPENDDLPRMVPPGDSDAEAAAPPQPATAAAPALPWSWQTVVAAVWLAGSAGWFLLAGWRVVRFRRLLCFAEPAPESLRKTAQRLARRLKLRTVPVLYLIPGRLPPMLWAVGSKPLLLVPRDLLAQLSAAQQETLLAHELAHLQRRDHWVRALEFVVTGLYWWHPAVWYACRALREAEEQCCDAWVVTLLPEAGKTYATALLETLDFLAGPRPSVPALASGMGQVSDLKKRLTMIMCATTPPALTWRGTLAVLALGLCVLPLLPTLASAQTEDKQPLTEQQLGDGRMELAQSQEAVLLQDEIAKARTELAQLQVAFIQKTAEIQELELRMAGKNAEADKQAALRHAAMVAKLQAISKAEATEIILRKAGDKWEIIQPKVAGKTTYLLEEKEGALWVVPSLSNKTPPVDPRVKPKGSIKAPTENRIDELEKQLKTVLLEIEKLRTEMKQPGTTGPMPRPAPETR
jgi:bla regulator protein blaR1